MLVTIIVVIPLLPVPNNEEGRWGATQESHRIPIRSLWLFRLGSRFRNLILTGCSNHIWKWIPDPNGKRSDFTTDLIRITSEQKKFKNRNQ